MSGGCVVVNLYGLHVCGDGLVILREGIIFQLEVGEREGGQCLYIITNVRGFGCKLSLP